MPFQLNFNFFFFIYRFLDCRCFMLLRFMPSLIYVKLNIKSNKTICWQDKTLLPLSYHIHHRIHSSAKHAVIWVFLVSCFFSLFFWWLSATLISSIHEISEKVQFKLCSAGKSISSEMIANSIKVNSTQYNKINWKRLFFDCRFNLNGPNCSWCCTSIFIFHNFFFIFLCFVFCLKYHTQHSISLFWCLIELMFLYYFHYSNKMKLKRFNRKWDK